MPIVLDGEIRNPLRPLTEYTAPLGDVLSATARDTLYNSPMSAMFRSGELTDAQLGEYNGEQRPVLYPNGTVARYDAVRGPTTDVIDAESARSQVQALGLKLKIPDDGIPERALAIIIERKQDEINRQSTMQRAAPGLGTQVLRLGTALGASLLDPLNVGLAFVPVVGEMRYAAMLARTSGALGRAGVRAGVGAVEGAAGAALIEPLIYSANQQEQADYTMADSLLNIALGTVFGGGLHVLGGTVKDRFRPATTSAAEAAARASPSTREVSLRAAVGQAAEGKTVNIEPLVRSDAVDRRILPDVAQTPEVDRGLASLKTVLEQQVDAPAAMRHPELGDISIYWGDANSGISHIIARRVADGQSPREVAETLVGVIRAATDGAMGPVYSHSRASPFEKTRVNLTLDDYVAVLSNDRHGEHENWVLTGFKRAGSDDNQGSRNPGATHENAPDIQRQVVAELGEILGWNRAAVNPGEIQSAGAKLNSPESSATADFPAARAADQRLAAAPKDAGVQAAEKELADALEQIKRVSAGADEKQGETLSKELKPFDEAIADADKLGDAARVGVVCGL